MMPWLRPQKVSGPHPCGSKIPVSTLCAGRLLGLRRSGHVRGCGSEVRVPTVHQSLLQLVRLRHQKVSATEHLDPAAAKCAWTGRQTHCNPATNDQTSCLCVTAGKVCAKRPAK